jgi:Helix-turn-helix domain
VNFLTITQVARLLARPRMWAWRHVRDGDFGPARWSGLGWIVQRAAVEKFVGQKFTDTQIRAAIDPGCIIPAVATNKTTLETVT